MLNPPAEEQCAGISELIRHIRMKSFVRILAEYLYTLCPYDDVTMLAYSAGKKPGLIYPQGSENHSPHFKNYLMEEYLFDLSLHEEVVAGKKVFRYAELLDGAITETEYYQRYYRFLDFVDEVVIRIPVSEQVMFFIGLGRREKLGEVYREEMSRLQQIYPVIEALCQQFWISQGEHYMPATARHGLLDNAMSLFGHGILTPREQEVAAMLLRGFSSKMIAQELNISAATVKVHRKHINARLNTSTHFGLFNAFLNYLDDYINRAA